MNTLKSAITQMSELTAKEKKKNPKNSYAECCRYIYEYMTPSEWKFENDSQFKLKKAYWEKAFKKLMETYRKLDQFG